jgi:hypothetical protein
MTPSAKTGSRSHSLRLDQQASFTHESATIIREDSAIIFIDHNGRQSRRAGFSVLC